ncbi:diguanylate cyclase domain-containing protein [Serratia ficaria]|uniref:diguanylate cyclase domain-containing protein n=1 Tax=Serratia ficaria TaxID=61651 RepID=UPI00077CB3A7|nr:diguanylate cyclase [Serratia ficaria]
MGEARQTLGRILQRVNLSVALNAVSIAVVLFTLVALLTLRAYANHNLHLIARSVGYTVEVAVVFEDRSAISEALALIASKEEVAEVVVFDKNGRPLADWRRPKCGQLHWFESLIIRWAFPEAITIPIAHGQIEVGTVYLKGQVDSVLRFLLRGLVGIVACLILSTLCALTLSRRMLAGILSSLDSIAAVAHTVRRERTFDIRVPPASIAELHELSRDFNCLLDELESWQAHLKKENDSLAHRATHDSLTGLPNRAFFEVRLQQVLDDNLPAEKLAVLFIDGDRFKSVNDTYGHAAGDKVLASTAARIRAQLRKSDLVGRIGGDEFVVLLTPINSTIDVIKVVNNIINSMKPPVELPNGDSIVISLSVGVAVYPDHAKNSKDLLHEADDAMYQAKHRYNSGWRFAVHK